MFIYKLWVQSCQTFYLDVSKPLLYDCFAKPPEAELSEELEVKSALNVHFVHT